MNCQVMSLMDYCPLVLHSYPKYHAIRILLTGFPMAYESAVKLFLSFGGVLPLDVAFLNGLQLFPGIEYNFVVCC
jgi:hypothetical protein